ncbi:hypoxanthine-DNA glycosylase [Arachidicoccus rhizosphaerae]|jgi:hypoxanthine-DNA glycosylase|uniref:Hypoxanthine-DNA glycosylase n=1 Tax=Arachidicoccus rhizosphaerae TaxID=551991 RepID=A0A1H3W1W3_9BACT|nr:uracil-DNA glycosylase family protein [Arachidicoccus rhizosphaerae]SDZ81043.1 hypoxanthine-DNA glycosylase [Arachidicoccus rhizosphaerae]
MQIETHPHAPFVPHPLKILLMGSFPGRADTLHKDPDNQWFYSAKRNQLWKILEIAFNQPLPDTKAKRELLTRQGIGIADILLQINRLKDSNADQDLQIIRYNDQAIAKILQEHPQVRICFTSRFVEKQFKRCFPTFTNTELLPSPSPRYARLSLEQKAAVYKTMLTRT